MAKLQSCACACGLAAFQGSNPDVRCWRVPPCPWQQDISSLSETVSVLMLDYFGCFVALKHERLS